MTDRQSSVSEDRPAQGHDVLGDEFSGERDTVSEQTAVQVGPEIEPRPSR
jgi:hypothetical protein